MAHVIQLALGAFMSSPGVKGLTKSWEAHERDQQFGENESIDIVTAQAGMVIPGNNRRKIRVVRKELCYGKAETLEDAEEAARWWRDNLVG